MTNGFKISEYAKTKFKDMSLGTQKKFFLSTMAVGDNHLLVLDEPSDALDSESKSILISMIKEFSKNIIVIIASHDREFIKKINPIIIELKSDEFTNFFIQDKVYA